MPVSVEVLERFRSRNFIETGMHRGDGIQAAIDAGFERIFSCDVSPFSFGWCCHRFRDVREQVNLHLQDSRVFLDEEMRGIAAEQSTFWLDAHYQGGNGEVEGWGVVDTAGAEEDHPLLEELKIIATYDCKTHTILIDDVRMFGVGGWPWHEQVVAALHDINPDYQTVHMSSALEGDDILCAFVETS